MMTSFTKVAALLIAAHLIFSQISAIAFSAKEWASLLDEAKKGDVEAQWTSTGEAIFTYEADALAFKLTFGL